MQQELFPTDKKNEDHNKHLWNQFIRLGEMIGDGLHHEEKWISKEYNQLAKILVPEIKQTEKDRKIRRNKLVDDQMKAILEKQPCRCGGKINQSRSGSKVAFCSVCNTRYVATSKK